MLFEPIPQRPSPNLPIKFILNGDQTQERKMESALRVERISGKHTK